MLIGEAPGYWEDQKGEPFVGKAGQLLDKTFACVGLSRKNDVYICNTLKCRPPDNRNPLPEEKRHAENILIYRSGHSNPELFFFAEILPCSLFWKGQGVLPGLEDNGLTDLMAQR